MRKSSSNGRVTLLVAIAALIGIASFILFSPKAPADQELHSTSPENPGQTPDLPVTPAPTPTPTPEPPYVPPQTRDPALAKFLNRTTPAGNRVSPDMASRYPRVQFEEDFPALVAALHDTGEDPVIRNEVANLLRRSQYPRLAAELQQVIDNRSETPLFRSYAVQHLGLVAENTSPDDQASIRKSFHALLDDPQIPTRREAFWALVQLKDPDSQQLAGKWLLASGSEADATRDLTIRAVREMNLRQYLEEIRKRASDEDEIVRIAAIVTLSEWKDEESRPLFESAAKSKSERLKRSGEVALRRLDESGTIPK